MRGKEEKRGKEKEEKKTKLQKKKKKHYGNVSIIFVR